jgi:hypothetical protein
MIMRESCSTALHDVCLVVRSGKDKKNEIEYIEYLMFVEANESHPKVFMRRWQLYMFEYFVFHTGFWPWGYAAEGLTITLQVRWLFHINEFATTAISMPINV